MKKKFYSEVKRLQKVTEINPSEDIVLIPGLNLFRNGPFKSLTGNNLITSLFAYKEHIYLNSDRYVDENEEVFNEIQFLPNVKLFELSGQFMPGFHHEEMHIHINSKDWTLKKYNICKDLECLPKASNVPHFVLKYDFSQNFLNYCQIDQLQDNDDSLMSYKKLKMNQRISSSNYMRALAQCNKILKDIISSSKKTSIINDIQDLNKKNYRDDKDRNIIMFALSQKKIIYNHTKLFSNRLIKEFQKDIFTNLKNSYIL